ncbi:MAG: YHS domain-containing protein [Acidobacteriota bacterium]
MEDIHRQPTARQVKDPVCGMIISADEAAAVIEHGDHKHYFCAEQCRQMFEADPKKYH